MTIATNKPHDPPQTADAAAIPLLRRIPISLLLLAAFASCLKLPQIVNPSGLDPSYQLGALYLLMHRIPVDRWIFPYGSLGGLMLSVYYPGSFWLHVAWQAITKSALILSLWRLSDDRLPSYVRLAFVFAIVLFVHTGYQPDVYSDILVVSAGIAGASGRLKRPVEFALVMLALACVSVAKFTFAVEAGIVVLVWEIARLRRSQAERLSPLLALVVLYVILWFATGNNPIALPHYLIASGSIAEGYNSGQSYNGRPSVTALGVLCGFVFIAGVVAPLCWMKKGAPSVVIITLIALALAWKHGFVRQDEWHEAHYFTMILCLPLFCLAAIPVSRRVAAVQAAAWIFCVGLSYRALKDDSFAGHGAFSLVRRQAHGLVHDAWLMVRACIAPASAIADLDAKYHAECETVAMPLARSIVDGATVDVMSYQLGIAIENGLNYQPRCALQSYAANCGWQDERDGAYYLGRGAPAFVLFRLQPIDGRLPAVEDRDALLALLRCYEPVAAERGMIVERRSSAYRNADVAAPYFTPSTPQQFARWNQWLDVPRSSGGYLFLRLQIRESLLGRLSEMLFHTPSIRMDVEDETHRVSSFRISGSNIQRGILLQPYIVHTEDLLRAYERRPQHRIVRVRIFSRGYRLLEAPSIGVSFSTCVDPTRSNPGAGANPERIGALAREVSAYPAQ